MLGAFGEVRLAPVTPADCDRVIYTRLNAAYRPRINLARLLLQHLSLEGRAGPTEFATYPFDMSKAFEVVVARYLARALAGDPRLEVAVQLHRWLDEDRKERGIPDILVKRDGRSYHVLDTKYKVFDRRPIEDDRNQMHMYCRTPDIHCGILIYANDERIKYKSYFRDLTLEAQALSLGGDLGKFRERCRQFSEAFVEVAK